MVQQEAAVAFVVCDVEPQEELLLIRRSKNLSDQCSGTWALPGGRRCRQDENLLGTALWETSEECGRAFARQQLVGFLAAREAGSPRLPALKLLHYLILYSVVHSAGVSGGFFIATLGGWWLLLIPCWYLTLVGARFLQVCGAHQILHGNLTRRPALDDRLGSLLSLWLMIENYVSYKWGHLKHHVQTLSTRDDPTMQSLERAGLLNGMTLQALRRRLTISLISPGYHFTTFLWRLALYGEVRTGWKLIALVLCFGAWAGITAFFPIGAILAWWVPIIIGCQCASLVPAVVEHWPESAPAMDGLVGCAEKTSAILCGVPLPDQTGNRWRDAVAMTAWTLQMAREFTCQFLFVSADGPNHDLHHLFPRSDWENDTALRLETDERVRQLGVALLTETWGFWSTFKQHLLAVSEAQPDGQR